MAKKKRETRRMKKAKQNPGALVKGKPTPPPSNTRLDEILNSLLIELAHHSGACFRFGFRYFEQKGRGCLFWLFRNVEHAANLKSLGDDMPCISYQARELARTFEYPPVLDFIDKYDPRSHFVALVAIRTGDSRDSLMKVTHLSKSAHFQAIIKQKRILPKLAYRLPKGVNWLGNEQYICSNHLCDKVEVTCGQYKKCGGCRHRAYCSRACQLLHWKTIHKKSCASEKEWMALDEKYEQSVALRKQELEESEKIKQLQIEKVLLDQALKEKKLSQQPQTSTDKSDSNSAKPAAISKDADDNKVSCDLARLDLKENGVSHNPKGADVD
eukprot:CAMPEP_0114498832 /NCGR_PEP_ID=MMETSP0109-20121206/7087_1 /TAXON_ID=29199 /ORGANISM="Chlorarachnion reptans, Strain CCCM449" /LENGTH=326 /DNA_ID=CAMNT_0001676345 /DNA_START=162 /DNA_END=1142 /DNA_ORIENTATION=-